VERNLDVAVGGRMLEQRYEGLIGGARRDGRARVLARTTRLAGFYLAQGIWRRLRYRD
jgi:hypothetical protein